MNLEPAKIENLADWKHRLILGLALKRHAHVLKRLFGTARDFRNAPTLS